MLTESIYNRIIDNIPPIFFIYLPIHSLVSVMETERSSLLGIIDYPINQNQTLMSHLPNNRQYITDLMSSCTD